MPGKRWERAGGPEAGDKRKQRYWTAIHWTGEAQGAAAPMASRCCFGEDWNAMVGDDGYHGGGD